MKHLPFNKTQIEKIIEKYPTPFHIYDEQSIRENIRNLKKTFSWIKWFKEYFAVKACPNPTILQILKEEWCWADCSSLGELVLSETVGLSWDDIMFTSNNTPVNEFEKALEMNAIINFDDISHIDFFEKNLLKMPEIACCRFNPGTLKKWNSIIWKPEDAKYGLTKEQLLKAYQQMKNKGVKRFWLHTMVASNELDPNYFIETASILFDLVVEISEKIGIKFEFINIGGGIGIPYNPEDEQVDLEVISNGIKKLYEEKIIKTNFPELKIVMEMWRMITGPYGYLVTQAIHKKDIHKISLMLGAIF